MAMKVALEFDTILSLMVEQLEKKLVRYRMETLVTYVEFKINSVYYGTNMNAPSQEIASRTVLRWVDNFIFKHKY